MKFFTFKTKYIVNEDQIAILLNERFTEGYEHGFKCGYSNCIRDQKLKEKIKKALK